MAASSRQRLEIPCTRKPPKVKIRVACVAVCADANLQFGRIYSWNMCLCEVRDALLSHCFGCLLLRFGVRLRRRVSHPQIRCNLVFQIAI